MRKISIALAACVVLGALAPLPSSAEFHCNVYAGSETDPHLLDPIGDYGGLVGGDGGSIPPYGDLNGDGTDVVAAWMTKAQVGTRTVWKAHIQLKELTGLETNAIWYFLWRFEGGDVERQRRWVSADVTRPGPGGAPQLEPRYSFDWGYLDEDAVPVQSLEDQGDTTGVVDLATNIISIDIPMSRMGNPQVGDLLGDILAESRALLGTSLTGGLVGVADNTDGDPCFELTV